MVETAHRQSRGTPAGKGDVIRWSLATAGFLAIVKVCVGIFTQSLAVLASAVDSLMDVMASGINFISYRAASSPPDAEHPYGHGKIEPVAGLFQSLFIAGSAGVLIWQAIVRLIHGEPLRHMGWGLVTMAASALITMFLVLRLRRAARRADSLILDAEVLHYSSDIWSNGGILLTLILIKQTGLMLLDPLVSFAVAVYIMAGAGRIFYHALQQLLDRRLPDADERRVAELILHHHPTIAGFHDLRTRRSGARTFIDVHVVFKDQDSFRAVHETTESLIQRIREAVPDSEVVIHMDPEGEP